MKFNDGNMSYVMCGQKKNLNFPVVDILLNYDHITLNFVFSVNILNIKNVSSFRSN